MGKADAVTKTYMRNTDVATDLIRLRVPGIRPQSLKEISPEEIAVLFDSPESGGKDRLSVVQRFRDVFFEADVEHLTDGERDYILIGFEGQNKVDYGMLAYCWKTL